MPECTTKSRRKPGMGGYSKAGDVKTRKVEEMGGVMRKTRQAAVSFQLSKFFLLYFLLCWAATNTSSRSCCASLQRSEVSLVHIQMDAQVFCFPWRVLSPSSAQQASDATALWNEPVWGNTLWVVGLKVWLGSTGQPVGSQYFPVVLCSTDHIQCCDINFKASCLSRTFIKTYSCFPEIPKWGGKLQLQSLFFLSQCTKDFIQNFTWQHTRNAQN